MPELDDATRRALLRHYEPPQDAQARVLTRLRSQLGPGGPGGGESPPPEGGSAPTPTGAEQLGWAAKVVGATAGLTGAGLLVLKLGAMALAGPSPPPPEDAEVAPLSATSRNRAERGSKPEPSSTPAPAQAEAPGTAKARSNSDRPSGLRPSTSGARIAGPGSELAAELALLDAAERLRSRDPEAALERVRRHDRRFPVGILAPERDAMRVELLCALGEWARAAVARKKFLSTYDAPQLRARVESSCAGTDPGSSGD